MENSDYLSLWYAMSIHKITNFGSFSGFVFHRRLCYLCTPWFTRHHDRYFKSRVNTRIVETAIPVFILLLVLYVEIWMSITKTETDAGLIIPGLVWGRFQFPNLFIDLSCVAVQIPVYFLMLFLCPWFSCIWCWKMFSQL